ncbi:Uncharacterised protein [Mycobacteroides abscessus subsp. abscessus]|nr:Uncharacterised protein [Mycobacteroides abscessus subsp. abscessus]
MGTPTRKSRTRDRISARYCASASPGPLAGTNTGRARYANPKPAKTTAATSVPTIKNNARRVSSTVVNTPRKPSSPNHSQLM